MVMRLWSQVKNLFTAVSFVKTETGAIYVVDSECAEKNIGTLYEGDVNQEHQMENYSFD